MANMRIVCKAEDGGACKSIYVPHKFCRVILEGVKESDLITMTDTGKGLQIEILSSDFPCFQNVLSKEETDSFKMTVGKGK